MDLEVSDRKLICSVTDLYYLETRLPYTVEEEDIKAKWDKSKHNLRVTCKVVQKTDQELKLEEESFNFVDLDDEDDIINEEDDINDNINNTNNINDINKLNLNEEEQIKLNDNVLTNNESNETNEISVEQDINVDKDSYEDFNGDEPNSYNNE